MHRLWGFHKTGSPKITGDKNSYLVKTRLTGLGTSPARGASNNRPFVLARQRRQFRPLRSSLLQPIAVWCSSSSSTYPIVLVDVLGPERTRLRCYGGHIKELHTRALLRVQTRSIQTFKARRNRLQCKQARAPTRVCTCTEFHKSVTRYMV